MKVLYWMLVKFHNSSKMFPLQANRENYSWVKVLRSMWFPSKVTHISQEKAEVNRPITAEHEWHHRLSAQNERRLKCVRVWEVSTF